MSAFSRQMGVHCGKCHKQIPQLNDYGRAFLKNYVESPEGKPSLKDDKAKKWDGGESRKNSPIEGQEKNVGRDSEASVGDRQEEGGKADVTTVPVKEPEPESKVHRWIGRDGSVYFTDNPYRRQGKTEPEEKSGKSALRLRRRAVKVKQPNREERQAVSVRRSALTTRSERQREKARSAAVASSPEHFRNREECMEGRLIGGTIPETAAEVMERFMREEQHCSRYPLAFN